MGMEGECKVVKEYPNLNVLFLIINIEHIFFSNSRDLAIRVVGNINSNKV